MRDTLISDFTINDKVTINSTQEGIIRCIQIGASNELDFLVSYWDSGYRRQSWCKADEMVGFEPNPVMINIKQHEDDVTPKLENIKSLLTEIRDNDEINNPVIRAKSKIYVTEIEQLIEKKKKTDQFNKVYPNKTNSQLNVVDNNE